MSLALLLQRLFLGTVYDLSDFYFPRAVRGIPRISIGLHHHPIHICKPNGNTVNFYQISRHVMTMDNFLTTDPQVLVEMTDQRIACTRVAYFSGFFF